MSGQEAKVWVSQNIIQLATLIAVGIVFYVTTVSAGQARDTVSAHASPSSLGHSGIVANASDIQLIIQRADILESQNKVAHEALMAQMKENTKLTLQIALKLKAVP